MSDNIIEYIKRREEERSNLLKEEQHPVEEEVIELTPEQKWVEVIKENKKEVVIQKAKSIDSSIIAKEKQKDQHKDVTFDDLIDTTEVVKKPTQPIVIEKKKKTIHEVLEETFANTIKERKQEQLIQQSNININFKQPFELEKLQEIALIEKINDIIKFRDPVLEKMEYREWLKVLQNKMVDELHPGYAKKLYEQDMSRVEKYEEINKKSGKGRNKVAVTEAEAAAEDPFTPADLVIGATDYWWNPDSLSATLSDGDDVVSYPSSGGSFTLDSVFASRRPQYIHNHVWSAGKVASGTGMPAGPANSTIKGFDPNSPPLTNGPSGNIEGLTIAYVVKNLSTTALISNKYNVQNHIGGTLFSRYRVGVTKGWSPGYIYDSDWEDPSTNSIRTIIWSMTSETTYRHIIPQISVDDTGTQPAFTAPTSRWSRFLAGTQIPVIYGECVILNYAISDAQIAQLQSYWSDKYGA